MLGKYDVRSDVWSLGITLVCSIRFIRIISRENLNQYQECTKCWFEIFAVELEVRASLTSIIVRLISFEK